MGESYIPTPEGAEDSHFPYSAEAGFAQVAGIADKIDLLEQYGGAAFNLHMRFEIYKYAMDGQPVTQIQLYNLLAEDMKPDDTLLDVGCADLAFLGKVRRDLNHQGELIGADVVSMMSKTNEGLIEDGLEPVKFIKEPASAVSLPPESVDKITASFVLYYDPTALPHLYEILTDQGILYVTTTGEDNKMRQRFWEMFATDHIRKTYSEMADLEPPPIHSAAFNEAIAIREMSKLFRELIHIPQRTFLKVDNEDSQEAYRMSLLSMYPNLGPYWHRTIDNEVMPLIREEIKQNGYYWDVVNRHIFRAKKTALNQAV